jgi:ABC-type multidrug transport system ATPase subunit
MKMSPSDHRRENSSAWHDTAKGFEVDIRDVSLVLTEKKDPTTATTVILDKVSAVIKPGRLLAIMGPSGSGKSSLLNVLAGRTQKNKRLRLFGKMFADGKPVDWRVYRRSCAYVTQDDLLFSNLTVVETMLLAARFRLPKEFTDAQRTAYADEIIAELGLNKVRDVIIGDDRKRGVSGGERKRVQIGVEIISSPPAM